VNYEQSGVPEEHICSWPRVTGRVALDLHTPAALEEIWKRDYAGGFSWPEQGLEIYLVGARNWIKQAFKLQLVASRVKVSERVLRHGRLRSAAG